MMILYKTSQPVDLNAAVSAALGLDHDPRAYRWQDDDDDAEQLVTLLGEHGIRTELVGSTVILRRGRELLVRATDSNRRRALCQAVVKLSDQRPELLG